MYAVYHGPERLNEIANHVHSLAASFAGAVTTQGLKITSSEFFDTVTVAGVDAASIKFSLEKAGYLVRTIDEDKVSVSFGESASKGGVVVFVDVFGSAAVDFVVLLLHQYYS